MVDLVVLDPFSNDGWKSKKRVKGLVGATDSEAEYRLQTAEARRSYDVPFEDRTPEVWLRLADFHELRGGTTRAFLLWDTFYCFAQNQPIGTGDGTTKTFQASTTIADAANAVTRAIRHPVPTGTPVPIHIALTLEALFGVLLHQAATTITVGGSARTEGTQFTVDPATGKVTFSSAPTSGASILWTGFYYTPVRFTSDTWDMTFDGFQASSTPPLIEVLGE